MGFPCWLCDLGEDLRNSKSLFSGSILDLMCSRYRDYSMIGYLNKFYLEGEKTRVKLKLFSSTYSSYSRQVDV